MMRGGQKNGAVQPIGVMCTTTNLIVPARGAMLARDGIVSGRMCDIDAAKCDAFRLEPDANASMAAMSHEPA
jgi:hypothetical protein